MWTGLPLSTASQVPGVTVCAIMLASHGIPCMQVAVLSCRLYLAASLSLKKSSLCSFSFLLAPVFCWKYSSASVSLGDLWFSFTPSCLSSLINSRYEGDWLSGPKETPFPTLQRAMHMSRNGSFGPIPTILKKDFWWIKASIRQELVKQTSATQEESFPLSLAEGTYITLH